MSLVTRQRKNDHDKVEQVPRLLEVVVPQGEYLEQTFRRKYHDEYLIESFQHVRYQLALLVMVKRHRQHVQPDEQHDEHVELFVRYDLEDDRLRLPLNHT